MQQRLGQHFLKNKEVLAGIVEQLDLREGDTVIEIGPGHGELTGELVNKFSSLKVSKFRLILIEKDKELVEELALRFKLLDLSKNIEVITGDILKILPTLSESYNLKAKSYKLVGNIPYYITGYLLRILGELLHKPEKIVLLVQKEVAERICAASPRMNLLAASVQFWAQPAIVRYVGREDFSPPPEIESAVIRLTTDSSQSNSQTPVRRRKCACGGVSGIRRVLPPPRRTS